jgi:type II secretory ATPase GspE/PulE/Tfp pilus assembly ATPase PilB-like protein
MQTPSYREAARPTGRAVTIQMLDGRARQGVLPRFEPMEPDLTLLSSGPLPTRDRLAAESIALIAFHRREGSAPAAGPASTRAPNAARVRVHLAHGVPWLVELRTDARPSPIGFWATPVDASTPYDEVFFYAHGVIAKESEVPLGELLVQEGRLSESQLSQGLAVQRASRPPLGTILVQQGAVDAAALEAAALQQPRRRLRIGEILVEAGLVSKEAVERALGEQRKHVGKRLGEVLVELGLVSEIDVARTLSKKFGLPFIDLVSTPPSDAAAQEVPRDLIEKFRFLPIATEPRLLTVALADPAAAEAIDSLRFKMQKRVAAVIAPATQLRHAIDAYLHRTEKSRLDGEMESILQSLSDGSATSSAQEEQAPSLQESDSAVIKLVNQMIIDAWRRGASDIHVEPNGKGRGVSIRFRIDGDCIQYQDIPATYRQAIVARIKIMSQLDISERRKPQDGKILFKARDRQIELRVATIPTVGENEDVVLRILAGSKPLPLDQLRFSERNLRELQALVKQPYGLILCVGPTGSGKTTTLHSTLGAINTVDMKIWTAEDPVEITQPGLRQVQVQPKIGFTFAAAMRAFLRADPDVIMVGEMRDKETAETAVEASLTGHLVFSTLHTNSAPETITRLCDMGLEPFSFADALLGVLAQRLVRGLCPTCAESYEAPPEERAELVAALGPEAEEVFADAAPVMLRRARGCEVCNHSGYKGRLGVHELLVNDDDIRHTIQSRMPVAEVRRAAIAAGMTTLLQDGAEKVLAGLTDLKQVRAVCSR